MGEKADSSIIYIGKTLQLHVKEWNYNIFYTTYENKLKMD